MSNKLALTVFYKLVRIGVVCGAAVFYTMATYALEWQLDKTKSQLLFKAGGFVKASGGFNDFDIQVKGDMFADPTHVVIHATLDTDSISTGSNIQDRILKGESFFNIQKFPKAEFNSTQIIKHDPFRYTILGKLTIKGISKPISFDLSIDPPTVDPASHEIVITNHGYVVINRNDWDMAESIPGVSNQITVREKSVIHSIR